MNRDLVLGCSFRVLVASVLLYVLARNFVKINKKSPCRKAEDTEASGSSAASSSSAVSAGSDSYDVFLSFHGKDTRNTFVDHLYKRLREVGIHVFRDNDELHKGEKFDANIFQAIKNSKISIPILSRNYASSIWCLGELVEMLESMKSVGHVVLPIFYQIEPSHVRHQKESFEKSLSHLRRRYSEEDVRKWRGALQEVASLTGFESKKIAHGLEGELVDRVVRKVLSEKRNAFQLVVTDQLVGIDDAVEHISGLLDNNPNAIQIVGIYGMGGIGKTTLAKAVYNKLSDQFQYRSFLADIRESSKRNGIFNLQNQLISDLKGKGQVANMDDGIRILESRFINKKVLVLLDDVNDNIQIKALVGKHDWFGKGSKIMITTEIRSILDEAGVKCKFKLQEMAQDKSLILFSRNAFGNDSPPREFESLSRDVVFTAGGLPLALEIIGLLLSGKDQEIWRQTLKKLKVVPRDRVLERLKISYDALNRDEQQIFLDIACFLIGADLRYASYMWDACNFSPKLGIETLMSMSLIKIGDHGELKMHGLLRDLGRELVRQEDYNAPINRSRSWVYEDALEVLERKKEIEKDRVQALYLEEGWKRELFLFLSKSKREFRTEQFETLWNLRFLAMGGTKLIGDSRSLLPQLLWLMWRPSHACMTTAFHLKKLVILDLSRSDISEAWEGWSHLKMAEQLKVLDLTRCNHLEVTPDLSAFRKLEIFRLKACIDLKQIHPSIGAAKGLVLLDLRDCDKLQELPQEMGKLEKLKELYVGKTTIVEIPPCIGSLKKLEVLYAAGCKSLVELPSSISHLVNLSTLDLSFCPKLCKLPESIGSLVKLQHLSCGFGSSLHHIIDHQKLEQSSNAGICELPKSIGDLKNLKILHIGYSEKLSNLPSTISKLCNLEELDATGCKSLGGEIHIDGLSSLKILQLSSTGVFGFHGTFDKLSHLVELRLDNCGMLQSLPELPASLTVLEVTGQHRTFPQLSHLIHLKELTVKDCPLLESLPKLPSGLSEFSVTNCVELKELPSLSSLESLARIKVTKCLKLSNLDGLEHLESLRWLQIWSNGPIFNDDHVLGFEKLKYLEQLGIGDCQSLVRLDVSQLTHVKILDICKCPKLLEIKGLDGLKNLKTLRIPGCPSIAALPDPSWLRNLRVLCVDASLNLPDIPGLMIARCK